MSGETDETLKDFLARVPEPEEIRRRIVENIQERQLLRQVLKISERQHRIAGVAVS
jgi:hypothetical protein